MSVSSHVSEAIYLISIIALSVLLARPVYLVYSGSQELAARTVSSGLAQSLNSMLPGMTITTILQSYPGVGFSVSLGGSSVVAKCGAASATAETKWHLPHVTLTPGRAYTFTLQGEEIVMGTPKHG